MNLRQTHSLFLLACARLSSTTLPDKTKVWLVSALIQTEEAGGKLSEDELFAMVFLLLIAGHETTVNLIGSGMLALMNHPDQIEMLRQNPSLIKTAVEELLRYTAPVFLSTEPTPRVLE